MDIGAKKHPMIIVEAARSVIWRRHVYSFLGRTCKKSGEGTEGESDQGGALEIFFNIM